MSPVPLLMGGVWAQDYRKRGQEFIIPKGQKVQNVANFFM